MAYTAADGPPELWATHAWSTVLTSPVTLNTRSYPTQTYPYIKVLSIGGWRAAPELVDNRKSKTYGTGEKPWTQRVLGKTLTYKTEVRAQTEQSLEATLTAALRSFGVFDGTMTVTAFDSSIVWTYTARCLAFTPQDEYSHNLDRPWRFSKGLDITLRMADPSFYTGGVGYL